MFWHSFGQMPMPMIDTQVLAAFTNCALSCGFDALVTETLDVTLDKTESRTDWLARPLSERQCAYADADVYWLLPMASGRLNKARKRDMAVNFVVREEHLWQVARYMPVSLGAL